MLEITNKNWKYIKVKGKCPRCGNKVAIGSCGFYGEPGSYEFLPVCTNEDCEESYGYGGTIKIRFINHRTVKIDGLWET
ncbi:MULTISPECIES: hypothetical protein [unclassified Lacrimispora]|uniref:hypothetical protein n=1 Tax=unclassified Lacrimispora TaxID=2719232 RepID=UPI00376FD787